MDYYVIHMMAVLVALWIIIWAEKRCLYGEKYPADKECAQCGKLNNVLTFSLYDQNEKICEYCADKEWKNRPRAV